jgi:hypothetical protein
MFEVDRYADLLLRTWSAGINSGATAEKGPSLLGITVPAGELEPSVNPWIFSAEHVAPTCWDAVLLLVVQDACNT